MDDSDVPHDEIHRVMYISITHFHNFDRQGVLFVYFLAQFVFKCLLKLPAWEDA